MTRLAPMLLIVLCPNASRATTNRADITCVILSETQSAVQLYEIQEGSAGGLDDLVREDYLLGVPQDGWGTALGFRPDFPILRSAGADRRFGTADDLTVEACRTRENNGSVWTLVLWGVGLPGAILAALVLLLRVCRR